MDSKTDKLLQQAGKYVQLGKLPIALEQYLKIHESEPEDTTIINTIGDLYVRLDDKDNALAWYHKLAERFEYRELLSNAMATYRKILKLSPKNHEAMTLLAQLYERQGQTQNAKTQYQMLAKLKMNLNDPVQAIALLNKVCELDPKCAGSRMTLAQALEMAGSYLEAVQFYLDSASAYVEQGNSVAALQAADNIFRLQPKDKEVVKSFFALLQRIDLTQRGLDYLRAQALDEDPEFKSILAEAFLQQGNVEGAQKLIQGCVLEYPELYRPAIQVLQELVARRDLDASLDLVEEIVDVSIRLKDESSLKVLLDSLLNLDETNVRLLKTLSTVLIRMSDKEALEVCLKRLVILQLRGGQTRDARESLNKLVNHGKSSFYLDLLNMIDDTAMDPNADMRGAVQKVIHALERGGLEKEESAQDAGVPLGVSELDLGMGTAFEEELQFAQDSV